MPTLQEKQSGMRLRTRGAGGLSPAAEARVRVSIYLTWTAGQEDLDKLARQFARPREWVKAWFDDGCPLL